jgi:GTP-binding protein HflX
MIKKQFPHAILASGITGEGLDELINKIEEKIVSEREYIKTIIPYNKEHIRMLLHKYGTILSEKFKENGIEIEAKVEKRILQQLK